MKRLLALLVVVGLVAAGTGVWYARGSGRPGPAYQTAEVQRGRLSATISATGTLEPEEVVDVGAQVAGMIRNFGPDPRNSAKTVDYGTPVEAGTVLAQIDDALYHSQVDQAKANVLKAEADLKNMEAKVHQAGRDWDRAKQLGRDKGVISGLDYDTTEATYLSSRATVDVGKAALEQAKAALQQAEINLGYCTIKSPVKGVIVDRRVNVGQTVVASLNAPSLFLIAKDLTRMQIWASVNEADIGQIHAGQKVRFTVDAHPGETFTGEVAQIRLNATMTQNVVTYTVVVNTPNENGKLLPYLTANLLFEVSQRDDVLLVPNSALRWQPSAKQVAPEYREAFLKAQRARDLPAGEKPAEPDHANKATVWVESGEFVKPVEVHVGLTDGARTEITSGLDAGAKVVTGVMQKNDGAGGSASPFTPQMFGGKKGS